MGNPILLFFMLKQQDSNLYLSVLETDTLPIELHSKVLVVYLYNQKNLYTFPTYIENYCGSGMIWTYEVRRQQIYSLSHLTTLEHFQLRFILLLRTPQNLVYLRLEYPLTEYELRSIVHLAVVLRYRLEL